MTGMTDDDRALLMENGLLPLEQAAEVERLEAEADVLSATFAEFSEPAAATFGEQVAASVELPPLSAFGVRTRFDRLVGAIAAHEAERWRYGRASEVSTVRLAELQEGVTDEVWHRAWDLALEGMDSQAIGYPEVPDDEVTPLD